MLSTLSKQITLSSPEKHESVVTLIQGHQHLSMQEIHVPMQDYGQQHTKSAKLQQQWRQQEIQMELQRERQADLHPKRPVLKQDENEDIYNQTVYKQEYGGHN